MPFPASFAHFHPSMKSMANIKQSKEKEKVSLHWQLNDKLNWQEGTERWQREGPTQASVYAHALCTSTFTHVHRQEAHMSTPHLPRYQNSISPDKLECARACCFLTLQVSVTFLSELHVGFTSRQRNPKWTHMSSFCVLSPSLSALSAVCYRMKQEYRAEVNIT